MFHLCEKVRRKEGGKRVASPYIFNAVGSISEFSLVLADKCLQRTDTNRRSPSRFITWQFAGEISTRWWYFSASISEYMLVLTDSMTVPSRKNSYAVNGIYTSRVSQGTPISKNTDWKKLKNILIIEARHICFLGTVQNWRKFNELYTAPLRW